MVLKRPLRWEGDIEGIRGDEDDKEICKKHGCFPKSDPTSNHNNWGTICQNHLKFDVTLE